MTWATFFENYLSHTIAIIALVQVWIIAAWKKWLLRGVLSFHPAANIEIGFSTFGSTIGLPGTLRATRKDVFVTEMRVLITRLQDEAKHAFTWRAFKSRTMSQEATELATSFALPVSAPRPLYVFFASAEFVSRFGDQAEVMRNEWQAFGMRKLQELGAGVAKLAETPGFVDSLFEEFAKERVPLGLYTQLNHAFFWQTGCYQLDLTAEGAGSTSPTRHSWRIEITPDDERKLRLNVIALMKELCNIQVQYNFIYKPYGTALIT